VDAQTVLSAPAHSTGSVNSKGGSQPPFFLPGSEAGAQRYYLPSPRGPRNPAETSAAYEAPMIFPYWLEALLDWAPAFLILAALLSVWWLRPAR
jgi:hypothetical protein